MTKRQLHIILHARRLWVFRISARPAYAAFPVGRWDISRERRAS